ncbi:vacuolar-type H+-ATPase subunit I/STV1 [Peptoniphilus olsenii]|uniref:Vacuolar-type H+-ATPase subunit I/STV1 n=1 Tax=Peptoniphilus olsenii TaxID=411570 RepID=A0ABV2JCU9_9FIRM
MDKKYLTFLVSELIFTKEDLKTSVIPQTYKKYQDIFGELEYMADELNLNIRALRRKIELLKRVSPQQMEEKVNKEFKIALEELSYRKNNLKYKVQKIDEDTKKLCDDIYREIIFRTSPELYNDTENEFERAKKAYRSFDENSLKEILKNLDKKKVKLTRDELEDKRRDLEYEISYYFEKFPLNQMDLLNDHDAIEFNLKKLEKLCEDYKMIYAGLQEELNVRLAEKID